MSDSIIERVRSKITAQHQGDEKQLEVIFSPSNRILVEAPAGYGKTNTLVSKVAYMLATRQIPNPKRLLALTFSVNAAYKIKKDVAKKVPALLEGTGLNVSVSDKIFVSNYHGFCRGVLKKYGRAFHVALNSIDVMESIDDSDVKKTQTTVTGLSYDNALFMSKYCEAVKSSDNTFLEQNLEKYCDILIKVFLPIGIISYNGILTLTQLLFKKHSNVRRFYTSYYSTILVDEYQDTNLLSYEIVKILITENTKVILLGDSLQRIYGFIGAVHNLLSHSVTTFGLTKIELAKNYRFASNPEMLQLDSNIRKNAENPSSPKIEKIANINLIIKDNQQDEAAEVTRLTVAILDKYPQSKVAILVKQRSKNIDLIISTFEKKNTPYFYSLFTDEDAKYIQFHKKCFFEFREITKGKIAITKKLANEHKEAIKLAYSDSLTAIEESLLILLEVFWERVFFEFSFLSNDEKINLIKDTFENNGLKQYLEYINSNIIISTVHAAKGLEWDFVILSDMEQDSFPNWFGLCSTCNCKSDCKIKVDNSNEAKFLEELSVFYVAVTRARRQVIFTSSKSAPDKFDNNRPKKLSCFLSLPGIKYELTGANS